LSVDHQIQTAGLYSIWLTEQRGAGGNDASDVSRPDRSGANQIDAEHQARIWRLEGSNPAARPTHQGSGLGLFALLASSSLPSERVIEQPPGDQEARQPLVVVV
jgi:hypothetical protein